MDASVVRAVQILAIINLAITGLSHVLRPEAWARFFIQLRERREPGVFVVAFLSLAFGSLVVAAHPVWRGIPIALTLYGWAQILKAAIYMAAPSVGLRVLDRIREERTGEFRTAGWFQLAFAGALAYHLWGW